jgi:hypothetical protein
MHVRQCHFMKLSLSLCQAGGLGDQQTYLLPLPGVALCLKASENVPHLLDHSHPPAGGTEQTVGTQWIGMSQLNPGTLPHPTLQ